MVRSSYLIIFSLAAVLVVSGCISAPGFDPQMIAQTSPIIQEFLNEHPNAAIRVTHFSATESEAVIEDIRADCDNPQVQPKEFYRVTVDDPDTSLFAVAWIDVENRIVECAIKHGTELSPKAQACANSGGTVTTGLCCLSTGDFPNLCLVGACGCSPDNSHDVQICECPSGKCFNGEQCVSIGEPSSDSCADTDGGVEPLQFGVVEGIHDGEPFRHEDECKDDVELREWYCGTGNPHGLVPEYIDKNCQSHYGENYICQEGECVPEDGNQSDDVYRVFVSQGSWNGNLGGLSGADAKCQAAAENAELSGLWKAWLSDDNMSAADRLFHSGIPYARIDGEMVAVNWEDLIDGNIIHPIKVNEFGNVISGDAAWTGTLWNGESYELNCDDWTSTSGTAKSGNPFSTASAWTQGTIVSCSHTPELRLYCFEQPETGGNESYCEGNYCFIIETGTVELELHGEEYEIFLRAVVSTTQAVLEVNDEADYITEGTNESISGLIVYAANIVYDPNDPGVNFVEIYVWNDFCEDSDGGRAYLTYGVVEGIGNGESFRHPDECFDGVTLREWYCQGPDPRDDLYDCSSMGEYICDGGKCVIENQTNQSYSCYDSDGGFVVDEQGAVYGTNSSGAFNFTDQCLPGSNYLYEFTCQNYNPIMTSYNCEGGEYDFCQDGACHSNPDTDPPLLNLTITPRNATFGQNVSILATAVDTGSGVHFVRISIDNITVRSCQGGGAQMVNCNYFTNNASLGMHDVLVVAQDVAHNGASILDFFWVS